MNKDIFVQLLGQRQFKAVRSILDVMNEVDIASLLSTLSDKELALAFRLIPKDKAAEVFSNMDTSMQTYLVTMFTEKELKELLDDLYMDDTVDMLEELPANLVKRILATVSASDRSMINQLLNYPEDSAGSIMNVEYIALRKEMTVEESILKIRQVGLNRETIYTCYVTEKRKLIGRVDVKELLTTGESRTIEEIMDTNVLYAHTTDDQEDVAMMINKYGLIALPIVDHEMCMVGIVTVDDAMLVMQEETTEDISIMAGMSPSEETYFGTSVVEHVKSRLPWLLFLMLSATVTQMIMNSYESALVVMPQLAGFIPMLTGTGGNCGSQSSTLVIRGLSVGEIEFRDLFKVIFKEVRVAAVVSVILAVVNGIRIIVMGQGDALIALSIGGTMICTVLIAKVVGCTLPMLASKIGLDPAIMATPLISTLVDISTVTVYFMIVSHVFHL